MFLSKLEGKCKIKVWTGIKLTIIIIGNEKLSKWIENQRCRRA